ncbi:MAG: polyphosphate kinase 1 [Actinomycetota bacterium]
MPHTTASARKNAPIDLNDPSLYINRELSWLEFNHRVLEVALDARQPLLERVKFLAIVSSNLDEFFMVRVAGLKRQVKSQTAQYGPDGMTAEEQLRAISARCHDMVRDQYRYLQKELMPRLAAEGIVHHRMEDLTSEQSRWVKDYFHRQVFPVLTPLALDPSHPFPHLRNRSLNLVVSLRKSKGPSGPIYLAVVQVPTVIPRLVQVPASNTQPSGFHFVLLEDVIRSQMAELFQGMHISGCYPFRITRDSDLNFDEEEAEDLLETIEQEVRKREWGDAVRLEVGGGITPRALQQLLSALHLTEPDIYRTTGPLNLQDFMALYRLPDYSHLKDRPFVAPTVRALQGKKDLFSVLREQDVLLHHPYESFGSVVQFVQQAAEDPDVLAIKQTLYRTSGDSPIIAALTRAAQNGKQVTALVELRARFDEENNIGWARELERAGVHVVYGLVGLKTHCKVLLVVRREAGEERLRRYVHLGTGNYNPTTAKLYTDLGLLTSSLKIGQDASRLFNLLTGYSRVPNWRKLSVAPLGLRERVLELIEREREFARAGQEGRIVVQMNSVVDPEVIQALYRASQAGVKIDLIVRGICCLRAKLPGVSDNIRVISIVGRFLEHPRLLYVRNGGEEEVYLSSGDWMPRNLSRRVETMFPIEDPGLKRWLLDEVVAIKLQDTANAWELQADGSYQRLTPRKGVTPVDSQASFLERALQRHAREPEPHPGAAFLIQGGAGEPDPLADRKLVLTELYPMRQAPPGLPADLTRPPDPQPPSQELHVELNGRDEDEDLTDASGL